MMRYNENAQRRPIGGHHFLDRGQIIRADTFRELVQAIQDYRVSNSWPLGDPEADVLEHYAKVAPWLVVEDGEPVKARGIPEHVKPLFIWLNDVKQSGGTGLCTKAEAKERWAGCVGCKYSSEIDWDYSPETSKMQVDAAIIRRMQKSPVENSYCRLHKWATGVAVFLAKQKVSPANKERSPDGCFVLKL